MRRDLFFCRRLTDAARRLGRLFHDFRETLPTRCPLCLTASAGGMLCAGCDADTFGARQSRSLCPTCALDMVAANTCLDCKHGTEIAALVCAVDFVFAGQLLLRMYKEGRQLALARPIARMMVRAATPALAARWPHAWVPLPASLARLKRNGFSPAQQLAREVAAQTAIPCRLDWLGQAYESPPQKTLNRRERMRAVKGRFVADPAVAGLRIGLIDDVVTTASTVSAAAAAFRAAGANSVVVLAAARTPRRV